MKFLCSCGYVIRDQTNNLPYKAQFIPDEDEEADFEITAGILEAFLTARDAGNQDGFLRSHFGEAYPTDLDTRSIISDLLTMVTRSARFIYECENCGRVFIQKDPGSRKNEYGIYLPEGDTRSVLRTLRVRRS